jgi:RimJ/RimL family protein N-acetyltransferase
MSTSNDLTAATIVFQEIGPRHYRGLASFLKDNNLPSVLRTFNPFPMTDETAIRIAMGPHEDHFYGAFLNGDVVGLSMLRGWDEGYSVPSFGIVIDCRLHNQGIGAQLTEFTIGEARRLGCDRVRLTVYAGNPAAIRVYAAKGFVESHREAVLLEGVPDEKITMFRELR